MPDTGEQRVSRVLLTSPIPPDLVRGDPGQPGGEVEKLPLSPVQHAMLLHSISAPGEGVYILQKLLTLHEKMNEVVFEQALRELFDRHPALRTTLHVEHPDGPVQVVHENVHVTLHKQDWRQLDAAAQQRGLRQYLAEDRRRPFDFAAGPPMRFAVFRTGDDEYEFIWTTHHALMDGRSLLMVLIELFAVYDELPAGRRATPAQRRPYKDYIDWLAEQDVAVAESFWRADLAGLTEPTPLVVDTVRALGPGEEVLAATRTELSEDVTAALKLLAREHQVTVNNFVQAAWAVLLRQLSGRDDVVFGTTRAGRGFLEGAAEMLGLFLNTVPFRVAAPSATSVVELLGRLRRHQLALRGFEHTSPTRIHAWSDIPAGLPLFDSVVVFDNHLPATVLRSLGGAWQHRDFRLEEQTNYPLTLDVHLDDRLILKLGYDRRRFADQDVVRMLAHTRRLLEAMASAPHASLAALPQLALGELVGRRSAPGGDGPAGAVLPRQTARSSQARTQDQVQVQVEADEKYRAYEAYWAQRLLAAEPLDLPYRDPTAGPPERYRDVRIPVPADLLGKGRAGDGSRCGGPEWLLTALLSFLARLAGEDGPDVDLRWEASPGGAGGAGEVSAHHLPFGIPPLGENRSFADLRAVVARQLDLLGGQGAHLRDVWISNGKLRAHAPWVEYGMPVAVELVEDFDEASRPRPATVLLVQIPRGADEYRWLVAEDVLQPGAADAMRAMFVAFLEALAGPAAADPTRIPLLSDDDRQRVLATWNDTDTDYPRDRCAHQLFMRRARHRPEAPAVVFSDRMLTYGELDRRSTQLAAFLGRQGIGPGGLVGIYLERSEEIVVAVLGVMKSGAAFVPLDPVYPPERIAHMITGSRLPLLLTQASLEPDVRGCPAAVVTLDRSWEVIATAGGSAGETGAENTGAEGYDRASPEGRAYVIYTSGSTGRPKGVQVGHRALTNLLCSMARTPGFTEDDRLLAVTTVCFDIAYLELLLPLVTGGQVEVVPAGVAGDGLALRSRIERSHPTVMQATPATWRMLIDAGWDGDRSLTVLCGGEPLAGDLADSLLARAARVWNLYGPTETTIWSSVDLVKPGGPVTIGRPIANTWFYVLDRWQQPVPPGLPGELYIGGDGVAAGYLGELELTRARFVHDPFGGNAPRVVYRTGDVVRHLPDGRLVYLHRADHQVKLHGYRIEPGEIETALRAHPGVGDVVVCLREDTPGRRKLVAYVVPAGPGAGPPPEELRRYLKARLPLYMVPGMFVTMTRLPLTANGKVDRRSLPPPAEASAAGSGAGRASSLTEAEAAAPYADVIAGIWRSVLDVEQVGIDENFFDAGGNSLLLMHVLIRLRAELSESLTRVDLFTYPTVRELASYLSASVAGRSGGCRGTGASSDTGASGDAAADDGGTGGTYPAGRSGRGDRAALAELRHRRLELRSRRPPGT